MPEHQIRFNDPDDDDRKRIDKSGRLYVGKDFAGETVEYAVERVPIEDLTESEREADARLEDNPEEPKASSDD